MLTRRGHIRPVGLFTWALLPALSSCSAGASAPGPAVDVQGDLPVIYENWETFTTRDGLPHDRIRAIRVCGEQVWIGTDGGLALCKGDVWRSWTTADGLPWPAITAIDVDERTQDVWLGTLGGGLACFSGGRFDGFDQRNSGLAGDLVFSVVVKDGRVWAATSGGVSAYDPAANAWGLTFARRADEAETAIAGLCLGPDPAACLYAAEWCGRVWRLDIERDRWTQVGEVEGRSGGDSTRTGSAHRATMALATGGRSLWRLTVGGRLWRSHDSEAWDKATTLVPMTGDTLAWCLAAPNEKEAWFGSDSGLDVLGDWDTGTWVRYVRDADGTGGCVVVRRGGRILASRKTASAIPDNRIRCIAFQRDTVWVGTVGGLARGTGRTRRRSASPGRPDAAAANDAPRGGGPGPIPTPSATNAPSRPGAARIAVLAPMGRVIAVPGADSPEAGPSILPDRRAVQAAVKQANERGGDRRPLSVVVAVTPRGYERYGWGIPEDDFAAYAYEEKVSGFVGHLGPDSRIAFLAALRTGVPVVNTATTAATVHERLNPWIFRCKGNDPRQHALLLDHVFDGLGRTRVAVLRSTRGIAETHLDWWSRHARRRGHPPVADVRLHLEAEAADLDAQLRALRTARPDVVLTWCDARMSAAMVRLLREAGITALFVGSDRIVCREFTRLAGDDPGVVIALAPCAHRLDPRAAARFNETYMRQDPRARDLGRLPPEACFSFDAAHHLMEAIDTAGPDRDAVREVLRRMSDTVVARLEHGEWKLYARSDLRQVRDTAGRAEITEKERDVRSEDISPGRSKPRR